MSYSARQYRYLGAMGIQRWVLRDPGAITAAPQGAAVESMQDPLPKPVPEPVRDAVTMPEAVPMSSIPEQSPTHLPPVMPVTEPPETELPTDAIATLGWEALQQQVAACQHCSELSATRSQTVFGVGNRQAEWLIIGEAPGIEEDQQGEPFVGPAGQLLNAMLAAIGLARQQVYIANVLKCRTPNNRDPHVDETAACLPYLHRQIALIQPKMILLLGRVAAQQLLGSNARMGELRGQLHRYKNNIPMIATYHPAYLLRKPSEKRKAWEDLCLARAQLEAR